MTVRNLDSVSDPSFRRGLEETGAVLRRGASGSVRFERAKRPLEVLTLAWNRVKSERYQEVIALIRTGLFGDRFKYTFGSVAKAWRLTSLSTTHHSINSATINVRLEEAPGVALS